MSSVVLIIYTQNLFDVIGYEWTFIIIGALSVLSKQLKLDLIKNFKWHGVVQIIKERSQEPTVELLFTAELNANYFN